MNPFNPLILLALCFSLGSALNPTGNYTASELKVIEGTIYK